MASGTAFKCCLPHCGSTWTNSDLISFPKNHKLLDLWLECLLPYVPQLKDLSKQIIMQERICNKHFEKDFLTKDGNVVVGEFPTLFSKKEIKYGVSLGTSADREIGDHNYSKSPDSRPETISYTTAVKGKVTGRNAAIANDVQTEELMMDEIKTEIKQEIVLLDYEEIDQLLVGPMAPLPPTAEQPNSPKKKKFSSPRTPFKCEECGRVFSARGLLVIHRRKHTREKPHVCPVCGRAFAQAGTLTKHQQTHSDLRPFECDICGKDFKYKWYFKEHLRIHDSSQHLICEVCSKSFVNHSALWLHARNEHSADNVCNVCNEHFPSYNKLQSHKLAAHSAHHAYKCSICSTTYSSKSYLKVHLLRHKYD